MRSEASEQTGEAGRDHTRALARGDVVADLPTPEELDYLTHHRIFSCLPEGAGYRKSRRRARRSR
jgi:hypothetical protein